MVTRRNKRRLLKYFRIFSILVYPAIFGFIFCYSSFQAWFDYTLKLDITEERAADDFVKLDYSFMLWFFSLLYMLATILIVGQLLLDIRYQQMKIEKKKKFRNQLTYKTLPKFTIKLPFLTLSIPRERSFATSWMLESSTLTVFYFFAMGLISASIKTSLLPSMFFNYSREYFFFIVFALTFIVAAVLLTRDILSRPKDHASRETW